ncbi:MAG: hypothetical protein M1299_06760 [Firmicutes bacterium]|nr:hypothetical protein [Bacillota bacterium]
MSIKPMDLQNALPRAAEVNRPREVQQQAGQSFQSLQSAELSRQAELRQKKVTDPKEAESRRVEREGDRGGRQRGGEKKSGEGSQDKLKEGEKGKFLDVTL